MAFVLPDVRNPFFAELALAFEAAAVAAKFSFSIHPTGNQVEREQAQLEHLARSGVDAVALVPAGTKQPALRWLRERGAPLVIVDRDLPGVAADCVCCDGEAGALGATNHLIRLGHKRIGCITGSTHSPVSQARLAGYRAAMRAAGLAYDAGVVLARDVDDVRASAATRRLLESPLPPTAIFAFSDYMAIGVLYTARSMGLRLPDELSVIGYDGICISAFTEPPLTTIEQPTQELGRLACAMLLERLADPTLPFRRAMLPTRLCVRSSTAPVA